MLSIFSSSIIFGGASLLVYWAFLHISCYLHPLRKLPYPPGPPPRDFILGNARDLLSSPLWLKLTDWATTYGSIIHFKAIDKHIVVLNSIDDAIELMEKRSNIYSDRPYVPMMELIGATFATPFKPYGPVWHTHRRHFQQFFKPSASFEYRPTQVKKVNDMFSSLLNNPEDFATHIKTLSVSIIMSMTYGYTVSPKNDVFQELAEDAVGAVTRLSYPGASIVNILPILRFLPTWCPGAHFHCIAREVKVSIVKMQDVPYKYVQDNLAAGTASPSFVASLLETCKTEEDHQLLKDVAATGYGAGAEMTTSTILTFIYAMAKFPDVQKRAQQELDRVIGDDRLVNFDDDASLPYVRAIYREVLRWRPSFPLGVFHATNDEDVYNGYYIPKGTVVIPNLWEMTRDASKYKNPEEFNPDCFLDENSKLNNDDVGYLFGFGRRICPGRHMAAATAWLAIATVLATFDIRSPKDASGEHIAIDVKYTDALVSHALPFKCVITPRSIQTKQLILDIKSSTD